MATSIRQESLIDRHDTQSGSTASDWAVFPDSSADKNHFGRLPWPVQVLPASSLYRITTACFLAAFLRVFFAAPFSTTFRRSPNRP